MNEWEAIVVDLDGGERLDRCLRSIQSQTRPPARVIIVDNGSAIPVSERVGDWSFECRIVRVEKNLGFTGGVNLGWIRSSSPLVALINNDVELKPEWAQLMIGAMEGDDHVAAVQSVIVTPEGPIDGAGIAIESGRLVQLSHGESLVTPEREPWGISATAALYRRAALEDVTRGGWLLHPDLFAYYEDVEISARLREAGWRVALVRHPLAVHEGSKTASRLGSRADFLRTRNRYFVRRLHPDVGRYRVLLVEDARKMLRSLSRLELKRTFAIASGVVAGCVSRIRPLRREAAR